MMNAVSGEMPRYRSHKEVWALQIATVEDYPYGPTVTLVFADTRYVPRPIEREVISRYLPKAGDYYVVYDDGYQSISPRAAFEDGYTRVT